MRPLGLAVLPLLHSTVYVSLLISRMLVDPLAF